MTQVKLVKGQNHAQSIQLVMQQITIDLYVSVIKFLNCINYKLNCVVYNYIRVTRKT